LDKNTLNSIRTFIAHAIEMMDENDTCSICVGAIENRIMFGDRVTNIGVGAVSNEVELLKEDEELTINVKLITIVKNEGLCRCMGYNPYCVSEGSDGNTRIAVPISLAKRYGSI